MSAISDFTKAGGWQTGRSSGDCHKYMLDNQVACDVTIKFTSAPSGSICEELLAHKYMLICRSPILETIVNGSIQDNNSVITITDIRKDVFHEVLRYIYHDGANLSGDNVLHVMYAAKKYLLDGLITQCKRYLDEEISERSACTVLSHSLYYNEELTTKRCIQYIAENMDNVLKSEDFANLTVNGIDRVFSSDVITSALFKETSLYRACLRWATSRQDAGDQRPIRDILGKSLYEIRFASLQPDELTKIIDERPDLLTQTEQAVLLRYVNLPSETKGAEVERLGFSTKRRRAFASKVVYSTGIRFAITTDYFVYNGVDTCDISFQVDRPVQFVGVTLYGGFNNDDEHSVHLALYTKSGVKQLVNTETKIVSEGKCEPIPVVVQDPVPLVRRCTYTIKVLMTGPHTYRGTLGRKEVRTEGVVFTFYDAGGSTCVEKGQIPQILFKTY
ncbi:hypothetical protein LSH36_1012g00027 [Paralvinella palmiformis]|uniref:BTB domain-containing protein n=1 Tax=Paralvinella palmiformis TaxID=53620 RepID=A0AAD9IX35_9ANNE|nr:hypothetical protein LSH36_1012g00027 [Paralvinella palmiformis]